MHNFHWTNDNMLPFLVTNETFILLFLRRLSFGWPIDDVWTPTKLRQCESHFQLSPDVTAVLWNHFAVNCNLQLEGWRPKCPLDALCFLKKCNTEDVNVVFAGQNEKTVRKWNERIIEAIASLDDLASDFMNSSSFSNGLEH